MLVIVRRGFRRFSPGGGVQPSEKNLTSKKKKDRKEKGEREVGEGGGGHGWLKYLFCFSMVEIYFAIETNSFTDNGFYRYDIPRYFLQAKHIRDDCFSFVKCISVSDGTLGAGGGSGEPPTDNFWFKWCNIV